jgi:hypothetical protein
MNDKKDYRIQSVLFNKAKVTLDDCFDWLVEYGFKIKKSYEDEENYRFQQYDTAYLKRNGFAKFVTKPLNDKVSVVMVYPKEQVELVEKPIALVEEPECVAFWVPTVIEILCVFLSVVGFFVLSSSLADY